MSDYLLPGCHLHLTAKSFPETLKAKQVSRLLPEFKSIGEDVLILLTAVAMVVTKKKIHFVTMKALEFIQN